MKKLYTTLFASFALAAFLLAPTGADAQCTTWVNPSDTSGWNDFTTAFNGAPCDDGTGCPFNEINAFEIWADEAYLMEDIQMGGTYTFSACNATSGTGMGGQAWGIEFTVITPSGIVDAFGLDMSSVCELTFTATETGQYTIVVSEAGACGTSGNQNTDNGYPAITCSSSAATMCTNIGIDELNGGLGVAVYPNPSTGLYTINADIPAAAVQVLDMNGRMVQNINAQNVAGQVTFDLTDAANGSYIVQVNHKNVAFSARVSLIH